MGLTTYLYLKKLSFHSQIPLEIVIYEKHHADSKLGAATVGGALGIAPNGVKVLQDLDEDLFLQVAALGSPISHMSLRNAHGWYLSRFAATDIGIPPTNTILISRQLFWETLRSRIPEDIVEFGSVARVDCLDTRRPKVIFADDRPAVEADLVIGADGVRSLVRKAVTGDGKRDDYPASFEGLVGVGSFVPALFMGANHCPGRMTLTFGADGFFGYGPCPRTQDDADQAVWWSTYQVAQLPEKGDLDLDDIKRQLQQRHSHWNDPVVQKIVANVIIDSIYPTWTTPELPTWESNGVVLVGDAAHALQTSSGQGVSQALEDAQTLSMLLVGHLGKAKNNDEYPVRLATKRYADIRIPRVKRIAEHARQMGDMKRN